MGGGRHRASALIVPCSALSVVPASSVILRSPPRLLLTPPCHSCSSSVIPALFRHSCVGRNPRAPTRQPSTPAPRTPPSPIHPSPLLGGRLGGGWEAPSGRTDRAVLRPLRCSCFFRHSALPSPSPAPPSLSFLPLLPSFLPLSSSFLRRQEWGRPLAPVCAATCRRRARAAFGHRWGEVGWVGARGSCLRRNDEKEQE